MSDDCCHVRDCSMCQQDQERLAQLREENERFKKGDVYRQGLDDGERHARFQYEVEIGRLRKVAQAARELQNCDEETCDCASSDKDDCGVALEEALAALDEKEGTTK